MYWRFTPAVARPCFSWPVSSSAPTVIRRRRDRRAASSSPAATHLLTSLLATASSPHARLVPPARHVLLALAHRHCLAPRGPAQQPLRPVRRPVPGMLGDRPPVPRRQVTDQRRYIPSRLQPGLRPGEAQPEQAHQGRPLPHRPVRPYAGSSSRLRFICPHKHMILGGCPHFTGISHLPASQQLKAQLATAVLGDADAA